MGIKFRPIRERFLYGHEAEKDGVTVTVLRAYTDDWIVSAHGKEGVIPPDFPEEAGEPNMGHQKAMSVARKYLANLGKGDK